jgi:F-type H+-transporting ATPase subunit b
MAQARERAESREHEIVEAAKQEAAGLVEGARKAIRAEQDKAISQIRNEVVELSLEAASRVLEREARSEDDRRIVSELISSREVTAN